MQAHSPREVHSLYARAYNDSDLDALLELYDRDAVVVVEPGSTVKGVDGIRGVLSEFLGVGGRMRIETDEVVESGATALLRSHWTVDGTAPDGSRLTIESRGTEVVKRSADGSWQFVIDNPFALQAAPPAGESASAGQAAHA